MEEQVPFKVYTYWSEKGTPEVRRFGVDKGVVANYNYLQAKLVEYFPGLREKDYCIGWKDEDGDVVTISSNDELLTALSVMCGGLIRLQVTCKDTKPRKESRIRFTITNHPDAAKDSEFCAGPSLANHFGVKCDVCDADVTGFRYKCTTCFDYDLCSNCEAAGNHSEHCMVRLPTPAMPHEIIKVAIKRSKDFLKSIATTVGEDCPYKKHRRDKSGEGKHRGDHGGDHHRGHHRNRDHHQRQRSGWLETFATYMNEYANLAGEFVDQTKSQEENKQTTTNAPASKKPEASNTEQNANAQPTSNTKQTSNAQQSSNAEESSTAESRPKDTRTFRIETSAPTEIEWPQLLQTFLKEHVKVSSSHHSFDVASNKNNDVDMGQGQKDPNVSDRSDGSSSSGISEREGSAEKADDWTVINKEKDLMDNFGTASASNVPSAPIGFNLPEEFQERVKIADGQSLYPPLNTATAESENPSVPAQVEAKPAQQPATAQQPAAAQPPKQSRPRHPEAHIDAAIQQMLAMGFTNEGGWLSQLLESKDGNIAAVLDLLTPVNKAK